MKNDKVSKWKHLDLKKETFGHLITVIESIFMETGGRNYISNNREDAINNKEQKRIDKEIEKNNKENYKNFKEVENYLGGYIEELLVNKK